MFRVLPAVRAEYVVAVGDGHGLHRGHGSAQGQKTRQWKESTGFAWNQPALRRN